MYPTTRTTVLHMAMVFIVAILLVQLWLFTLALEAIHSDDFAAVVVKNRASCCQAGACAPTTAARAAATRRDSRATSSGSGDRVCTTDRWVAARW